jgi:hypothetical protein
MAMMLFVTILTVVAIAFGRLARAEHRTRARIDRQRSLQQFVVRLRQDIHAASSATITPSEAMPPAANADAEPPTQRQGLTLVGENGRTIRFQTTVDGIDRTISVDGTEQHRESYVWGSPAVATWSMDTTQELPIAILTLSINRHLTSAPELHVVQTTLLNSLSNTDE